MHGFKLLTSVVKCKCITLFSRQPSSTAMLQKSVNVRLPTAARRFTNGAGALGFRDFPGLLTAKENRTGSRQTLLRKRNNES